MYLKSCYQTPSQTMGLNVALVSMHFFGIHKAMGLASSHVAKRHKRGRRRSLRVGANAVVRHDFRQSQKQRRLPETTVQSQDP